MTVATLSSAGLTQLTRLFRDRMIGYTSVVPPLDVTRLAIVRDLQRDADAFIGPEAATFEGLEAYINLRLCTEAVRRAGPRADGQRLADAVESLGALDLGGFRLVFGRDRHHGSDYVEIGMRARDGRQPVQRIANAGVAVAHQHYPSAIHACFHFTAVSPVGLKVMTDLAQRLRENV